VEPKHNPAITHEQKDIYNRRRDKTDNHPKEAPPLINFQYSPPKKNPMRMIPSASMYPPVVAPNPYGGMGGFMEGNLFPIQVLAPVKHYDIHVDAPVGDHTVMSRIFEDALPLDKIKDTFQTINDRLTILLHVRNSIFGNSDGIETSIDGSGNHSIMHYIKYDLLNPYYSSPEINPYKFLPSGYVVYRSCYPIVKTDNGSVSCAKDSININVKCYELSENAYQSYITKNNVINYDVWREIAYYEYVREAILKTKMSPNFALMFGYGSIHDSKIGYAEIDEVNGRKRTSNDKHEMSIVSLTESPTYKITEWTSILTNTAGVVVKTVSHGIHTADEWFCVLFQLLASLYVMQIMGIKFNNFSLADNVFIKDISSSGNLTCFWKYNINGIDYYIPNFGFMLLIDTNYKDVASSGYSVLGGGETSHKIDGSFLTHAQYEEDMLDMLSKALSFEIFKNVPPSVLNVISDIKRDINTTKEKDIGWYIEKYMTRFINNRIGTLLKVTEIENVKPNEGNSFNKGDIVVYKAGNGQFKFVLYLGTRTNGEIEILLSTKNYDVKKVNNYSIVKYEGEDKIMQNFKPNESKMNEDDLLEIYTINKD
jgi:hypothetical protein